VVAVLDHLDRELATPINKHSKSLDRLAAGPQPKFAQAISRQIFPSDPGREPLKPTGPRRSWLESRTKTFGNYETVRKYFALFNIGAYHSKITLDPRAPSFAIGSACGLVWCCAVLVAGVPVALISTAYYGPPLGGAAVSVRFYS
jgi:hypothetical protein